MDTYEEELIDLNFNNQGDQYLFFLSNGDFYAMDALRVAEIIEHQPFTKVPMMQSYVKGVTNVRGDIIAVIDLMGRFGFGETTLTPKTSLIITSLVRESKTIKIAMMIDEVFEVKHIDEAEIKTAPEFGSKIDSKFVKHMCKHADDYIPILDVDALLDIRELSQLDTKAQP